MQKVIDDFHGKYRFLSNFWSSWVIFEGFDYPTVEHAYQAAKTLDQAERKGVREAKTPGDAKKAGKRLTLREDWEEVKFTIMENLVRQKFIHPELREKLMKTGTAQLIEGNTWGDKVWGMVKEGGEWVGENNLGKILMRIRDGK